MSNPELSSLRRARSRCHLQLKNTEAIAEGYRAKLADLEARIRALAPELDLPVRFRNPNPFFARGELRRFALDMLRESPLPLGVREIARVALASKGERFPAARVLRVTCCKLSIMLTGAERRGLTQRVGTGRGTKRVMVASI